jgi:ABC-2 type transport system ATP-binding protein
MMTPWGQSTESAPVTVPLPEDGTLPPVPRRLRAPEGAAVSTAALTKRYGRLLALDGVDITVPSGAVYVLVGPNGAGKSTLLKVLLDLVVPDAGSAQVFGVDTHRSAAVARAQIGYVPERDDVAYDWIRVDDLLRCHAAFFPCWDALYASELARLFEIRPASRLGSLSKGQQRRVQLLLALAHCPPLLVLDEPLDGLDPLMRDRTIAAVAEHMARFETTVLMSTHQVQEAERLCDHVCVMSAGRIVAQVTRDALRSSLRRYTLELPAEWTGSAALESLAITRSCRGREAVWSIWGEERAVVSALQGCGAVVRGVAALTLHEATLALLTRASGAASTTDAVQPEPLHAGGDHAYR